MPVKPVYQSVDRAPSAMEHPVNSSLPAPVMVMAGPEILAYAMPRVAVISLDSKKFAGSCRSSAALHAQKRSALRNQLECATDWPLVSMKSQT